MAFKLCEFQQFDDNGDVLAGGKINVYEAGTTTPKDSYPTADDADAGTNANTNPVILDSAGRGQIWGKSGEAYKVVITDAADVTQDTIDDITAPTNNPLKVYTAGGTADALTITLDPNPGAWSTDVSFYFRPTAANTGSATININGIGAKTLKLPDASTNLPAGYLQTSNVYGVWYDGTNAVVVSAPAVIEHGSDATNGEYVRYSDGTQECWFTSGTTITTTAGTGNVFSATAGTWTYAKAFSTAPVVTPSVDNIAGLVWPGQVDSVATDSALLRIVGATNSSQGIPSAHAIGLWYS